MSFTSRSSVKTQESEKENTEKDVPDDAPEPSIVKSRKVIA